MAGAGPVRRIVWLACVAALVLAGPLAQSQADATESPGFSGTFEVQAAHGQAVDKDAPADDADDGLDALLQAEQPAVTVVALTPAPPTWRRLSRHDDAAALTSRLTFDLSGPRAPPASSHR